MQMDERRDKSLSKISPKDALPRKNVRKQIPKVETRLKTKLTRLLHGKRRVLSQFQRQTLAPASFTEEKDTLVNSTKRQIRECRIVRHTPLNPYTLKKSKISSTNNLYSPKCSQNTARFEQQRRQFRIREKINFDSRQTRTQAE